VMSSSIRWNSNQRSATRNPMFPHLSPASDGGERSRLQRDRQTLAASNIDRGRPPTWRRTKPSRSCGDGQRGRSPYPAPPPAGQCPGSSVPSPAAAPPRARTVWHGSAPHVPATAFPATPWAGRSRTYVRPARGPPG
jgi:hypothetical protein